MSILVQLRDLKRYIQGKCGHESCDQIIQMLMNVAAKIKADKIKAVEAVEEMLIAEQERLAAIKYKLLRVVGSIMEGKMENLSLVSRDKVKIKTSADQTRSCKIFFCLHRFCTEH